MPEMDVHRHNGDECRQIEEWSCETRHPLAKSVTMRVFKLDSSSSSKT